MVGSKTARHGMIFPHLERCHNMCLHYVCVLAFTRIFAPRAEGRRRCIPAPSTVTLCESLPFVTPRIPQAQLDLFA